MKENGREFSNLGPEELIMWQRKHPGEYGFMDVVQEYIIQKHGTPGYKVKMYGCLRSFFLHNRAELPRDPSFRVKGDRPSVVGKLNVEDFKRVLASCNPMYRAVWLCMFQAGMGVSELLHWDQHGFESVLKQLKPNTELLKIELPGRKKMKNLKPYYTFISTDACDALRIWIQEYRGRVAGDSQNIFMTQFRRPLSYNAMEMYWLKKLERLGIIKKTRLRNPSNRYGRNMHELRDLFRTRWRPSEADVEVAEFFMGHSIDELGYDKSPWSYQDWFEEQYRKAMPWMNIISEDPEVMRMSDVKRMQREIKTDIESKLEVYESILKKIGYADELEQKLKEVQKNE